MVKKPFIETFFYVLLFFMIFPKVTSSILTFKVLFALISFGSYRRIVSIPFTVTPFIDV